MHAETAADFHANAKPLNTLGIDADDHRGESCHVVVAGDSYRGARAVAYCTDPGRHRRRGDSD